LRQVGDLQGEADAWDSLGYAHHQLAHHRRAIACYGNALRLFARTGDRYAEARTLVNVGATYRAVADTAAARSAWRQAVTILDLLGHADADQVRADLAGLAPAIDGRQPPRVGRGLAS
jgi:tetratricopeptide (TPR) repeat protein